MDKYAGSNHAPGFLVFINVFLLVSVMVVIR